jgi:hypothetical protein
MHRCGTRLAAKQNLSEETPKMRRLALRLLPLTTLAGTAAALALTGTAQAGILLATGTNCATQTMAQTFQPWLDPAQYTLVPGGTFEAGATPWALSGGAATTAGNESFYVHSAGDSRSVSLPAGSSATSPIMQNPDLRLFALSTGSTESTLQVSVNYVDALGAAHSAVIAQLTGGSSWAPSLQMPLFVNNFTLLPGSQTPVSFTFAPQGSDGGVWQIDDTYVDPWGRCC